MSVDLNCGCALRAEGICLSKQLVWDASCLYPLKESFLADPVVGPFHVKADQTCDLSTALGGVNLFLEEYERLLRRPLFTCSEVVGREEPICLNRM